EHADGDDDIAHAQAGIDDQGPTGIGQELDKEDPGQAGSGGLGRGDVVAIAQLQGQAPHDAHDAGSRGEGDGQDDVQAGRPDQHDDHDVEDQHRKGENDVRDPVQEIVDPAAEIARQKTEDAADEIGAEGGD